MNPNKTEDEPHYGIGHVTLVKNTVIRGKEEGIVTTTHITNYLSYVTQILCDG